LGIALPRSFSWNLRPVGTSTPNLRLSLSVSSCGAPAALGTTNNINTVSMPNPSSGITRRRYPRACLVASKWTRPAFVLWSPHPT